MQGIKKINFSYSCTQQSKARLYETDHICTSGDTNCENELEKNFTAADSGTFYGALLDSCVLLNNCYRCYPVLLLFWVTGNFGNKIRPHSQCQYVYIIYPNDCQNVPYAINLRVKWGLNNYIMCIWKLILKFSTSNYL